MILDFINHFTFLELLVVVLFVLLFFKEQLMPFLFGLFGKKSSNPASQESFDNLAEHVNHRQTEIMERQTELLEHIKEAIQNVNRKHEEWEKYGIPTRGCKIKANDMAK